MDIQSIPVLGDIYNYFTSSNSVSTRSASASASAVADPSISDRLMDFLDGRGEEIMASTYSDETVGLTACGLVGEAWAPDYSSDAGIDGDTDADIPDAGDAGDADVPDADPDGGGDVCDNFPGSFVLQSPTDGLTNVPLSVTLDWSDSIDPDADDAVRYRLELSLDGSFTSPTVYDNDGDGIIGSQLTIPDTLLLDQTYYWRVVAIDLCDQETVSEAFSFTTIAECTGNVAPNNFSLTSPVDAGTGIPVATAFDWADAIDMDGDDVTYVLQINTVADFTTPLFESDPLTDSNYTLQSGEELANDTTHYWRVVAYDPCLHDTASTEVFSFTTEVSCIIQPPIVETAFSSGSSADLDHLWAPGSIRLARSWTYEYEAGSMSLPNAAGWTLTNPSGGTTEIITDPVSGEISLHISTIGTDDRTYYDITPSFSNATGWSVAWRSRIASVEAGAERLRATVVEIIDDAAWTRMGMVETEIQDLLSVTSHMMDTSSAMHNFRIEALGANYTLYVDGASVPASPWAFAAWDSQDRIRWGDYTFVEDSDSYWSFFRYYNAGNSAPFFASATYESQVYDLLSTTPNLAGGGANISVNGDIPLNTDVTFQTRSGTTPVVDGGWSGWQDALTFGHLIQSPVARYIQVRTLLSTTDTAVTPRADSYDINYCTY